MRDLISFSLLFILSAGSPAWHAAAQVEMGVSMTEEGLKGFYLAIGDHYKVPQKEVVIVRERRIPDEEIPVVFFIAKRAGKSRATVIELRLSGKSWMEIAFHFRLSVEIFYVEVKGATGPPYGKALGYFKKTPRKKWETIVLADADVVNLVNLQFVSEHYGYSPGEVIKMRAKGKSFVRIHDDVKKAKKEQQEKAKEKKRKQNKGSREIYD